MTKRFAERFPDLTSSLRAEYDANGHAYHNWLHIQALLADFERLIDHFANPLAVEAALYFHDVVYVPGTKDNEVQSAARLVDDLEGHLDPAAIAHGEAIVLATAAHRVPPGVDTGLAGDCALFLDMDLAILGADAEAFDAYDTAIRSEYAAIPDQIYLPGRRQIMQGFLDREEIYLTAEFRESHDAPARDNLRRLVALLSA